ncbi:uncharacterized protein DS421_4g128520 [Arachis hypogaea]|nr:uncharacterized protein DS421_4g128520 [Arachis hypogaea]
MEKAGRESASEEEGGATPPPHSVTPSRVLLAVVPSTHAEKEERNRGEWRRVCRKLATGKAAFVAVHPCRHRSLPSREVIRHRVLAALSHQHRCCYSKIPFLFLRVCYLSPLKLRRFCSCRYLNLCRRGYCRWSR